MSSFGGLFRTLHTRLGAGKDKPLRGTRVVIGIPCFQCAETVGPTTERLIDTLAGSVGPGNFKIHLHDDGSDDEGETRDALQSLSHQYRDTVTASSREENLGVARAVPADLYPELFRIVQRNGWPINQTIIGRTDPDGEFDEEATPRMIQAILNGAAGVIAGLSYTPKLLGGGVHGEFDFKSHQYLGELEGNVVLAGPPVNGVAQESGRSLGHHCPGKQLHRGHLLSEAVNRVAVNLVNYFEAYGFISGGLTPTWGIDLVIAAFVSRLSGGNVLVVELGNSQITQRRDEAKILKQLHDALIHLRAIRHFELDPKVSWTV